MTSYSNWMRDTLDLDNNPNLTLADISIPGSHDAGMYELTHNLGGGAVCNTITQSLDIAGQLKAGMRYFDLRPYRYNTSIASSKLYLAHTSSGFGATGAALTDVLDDVKAFAASHQELIILKFSHFTAQGAIYGASDTLDDTVKLLQSSDYKDMVTVLPSGTRLSEVPLKDLIGKGSAVVTLYDLSPDKKKHDTKKGVYSYKDYNGKNAGDADVVVFDEYSNNNKASGMMKRQFKHWGDLDNFGGDLFLLSWTCTLKTKDAVKCPHTGSTDIGKITADATKLLVPWVLNFPAPTHQAMPNIIYTDFSPKAATDLCIQLNGRTFANGLMLSYCGSGSDRIYTASRDVGAWTRFKDAGPIWSGDVRLSRQPNEVDAEASDGPAIYQNDIWTVRMIYADHEQARLYGLMNTGIRWDADDGFNALKLPSKSSPTVAVNGETVMVVYLNADDNGLAYTTYNDGAWTDPVTIVTGDDQNSHASQSVPRVVSFNNAFHVIYRGESDDYMYHLSQNSDGSWTDAGVITVDGEKPVTKATPGAVSFDGTLHVIYRGKSNEHLHWMGRSANGDWTGDVQINHDQKPESGYGPAVVTDEDQLYVVYRGAKDDNLYILEGVGGATDWTVHEKIKDQGSIAPTSSRAPQAWWGTYRN